MDAGTRTRHLSRDEFAAIFLIAEKGGVWKEAQKAIYRISGIRRNLKTIMIPLRAANEFRAYESEELRNLSISQIRCIVQEVGYDAGESRIKRLANEFIFWRMSTLEGTKADSGDQVIALRALQLELSGHFQDLRYFALGLSRQLHAPVIQLLALSSLEINPGLLITSSSRRQSIHLALEEDRLFQALMKHLPDSSAWTLLTQWKNQLLQLDSHLKYLCQWVEQQLDTQPHKLITLDELSEGKLGLTEKFPKSVVLGALEDAHWDSWGEWTFSLETSKNRDALLWTRDPFSFALAACGNPDEVDEVRHIHTALRERMADLSILTKTIDCYREFVELGHTLNKELEHISRLATFPSGRDCDLCPS